MLRSLKFYGKLFTGIVFLIPKMLKCSHGLEEKIGREASDKFVCDTISNWAETRLKDSGAQVIVHGEENIPKNSNMLIVSNHISNFDFLVILAKIKVPLGFVAKIELKKIPLFSNWMEIMHSPLVDRNDMRQQLQAILHGIELLKDGRNLAVFPEGTRSKTGEMAEFKAGSFKLATKSKVPILPVTVVGTAEAMENNNNFIKAATMHFYIHKPIYVTELEKEEVGKIHKIVENIVRGPLENNEEI